MEYQATYTNPSFKLDLDRNNIKCLVLYSDCVCASVQLCVGVSLDLEESCKINMSVMLPVSIRTFRGQYIPHSQSTKPT